MNREDPLRLFEPVWNQFIATHYPATAPLHESMQYALSGKGKRVRAQACILAAQHYSNNSRASLSGGVAVEMIHTYSLVHDDLPCLDNDDWRRDRPSVHKVFGEATAVLSGDGILTDAFRVLTDSEFFPDCVFVPPDLQAKQVAILAAAAGGAGMVLGQAWDIWWTGRDDVTTDGLDKIHLAKTGALLGASFALGAASMGASSDHIKGWTAFGQAIGLAFQAIDDTLDNEGSIGKTPGKDAAQKKLTYLRFQTKEEIRNTAFKITEQAFTHIPLKPLINLETFVKDLVFRNR
ncbi:MAG: polyprenyl synthetase family protein [Proteobacteria bacterium]|nr:polyprenyl synthetase family protein [Pseudomonadota bacterium]